MDFYTTKRRAFEMINKLLEQKTSEMEIIYIVQTNFGIGKKSILERIDLYNKMQDKEFERRMKRKKELDECEQKQKEKEIEEYKEQLTNILK